jgi:hypothetical protein
MPEERQHTAMPTIRFLECSMTEHRWYELWGVWLEPREVLEQPPSSRVPCSYRDCGCTGLVGRISVDGVLLMQSRSGFVIKAEGER